MDGSKDAGKDESFGNLEGIIETDIEAVGLSDIPS